MLYEYLNTLEYESRSHYLSKLEIIQLKECPYRLPADVWIDDTTKWPNIEYPDLYEYLINTPGVYTKESMKSRKSLEAFDQFQSGWVGKVLLYERQKCVIMKAKVMHSQRLNENPLEPWIAANDDGSILCAHCNCMAGLGESCSHIGALLFKIEAAVRLGYTKVACTDVPCQWNNDFVSKIEGTQLKNILFYKKDCIKNPANRTFLESTEREQREFLDFLKDQVPKDQPVGLSLFRAYSENFHHQPSVPPKPKIPNSLRDFFCPNITADCINDKVTEIYTMQIQKEDRQYIEHVTKMQSQSMTWREMRVGRITASVAHDVLHCKKDPPPDNLIHRISSIPKELNVQAVLWGLQHETDAIETYKSILQKSHTGLKIEKSGLRLDDEFHMLGASADAIASCDCHGNFIIEIKCPYKHRESKTVEECVMKDAQFCIDQNSKLKGGHRYMSQVQMQMYIYKVKTCHFVIWTPNFCQSYVIEQQRDFVRSIKLLVSFHKKFIGPELVTRNIEQTKLSQQAAQETNSNVPLFCYCKKPECEEDDMIGCDNPGCKYKWVHFRCAKIKRPPKNSWYCRDCKKNKK